MKPLFLVSLLPLLNLSAHATPFIVGGKTVSSNDFIAHSVVALVSKSASGEALCTASLVNTDLAITAAHCVTDASGNRINELALVFARTLKGINPDKVRRVDQALVPADWNPAGSSDYNTGDVALIHFSGGLPEGYSPSDLLPFDQEFQKGDSVMLAGYGITNAVSEAGAGILRKREVKVLNPNYSDTEIEFDQSEGGGACHGDSGGPAYFIINGHPYLFGITSRGAGNCDIEVVYSKISAYSKWFKDAVAKIRDSHLSN